MVRCGSLLLLLALALCATSPVRAAGTTAGTSIQSAAQITYSVGGAPQSVTSNTVNVIVVEILDVVVTVAGAGSVSPGGTQQELVFTVTNTGNGTESFDLAALSAGLTGDQFDPTLAVNPIYFDTDNSNDLSAGDTIYVPGTNDPVLAADASVRVILVNDIPAGAGDGQRGRSQLTATARTGSGAPGTLFAGQGDGGLDAMAGNTGARAEHVGEYVVAGLQLAVIKSQTVVDPFGGSRATPGARINYQIVVTATGSGTAVGALFNDTIPVNTTYVPGTLRLNSDSLSDDADSDGGELASTPAPQVRITLGDLTPASASQTIEFAVTID
ncbi:hypothetical protein [Povalibacter sp.]|uniref:hypothetical protein n=1 Tax=Povalibacter sp. TaxID=1962978 RepID=UPI002F3E7F95